MFPNIDLIQQNKIVKIEKDITTVNSDISAIEGNISTIQSDITDLQNNSGGSDYLVNYSYQEDFMNFGEDIAYSKSIGWNRAYSSIAPYITTITNNSVHGALKVSTTASSSNDYSGVYLPMGRVSEYLNSTIEKKIAIDKSNILGGENEVFIGLLNSFSPNSYTQFIGFKIIVNLNSTVVTTRIRNGANVVDNTIAFTIVNNIYNKFKVSILGRSTVNFYINGNLVQSTNISSIFPAENYYMYFYNGMLQTSISSPNNGSPNIYVDFSKVDWEFLISR